MAAKASTAVADLSNEQRRVVESMVGARVRYRVTVLAAALSVLVSANGLADEGREPVNGPRIVLPTGHSNWVNSVAFSPDGKQILTGSDDSSAILWDIATGRQLRTLQGLHGAVTGVAFSPDGRQGLTCVGGLVRLWDLAKGQPVRSFIDKSSSLDRSRSGPINCIAVSVDGKFLATGSRDSTAALWDIETGKLIRTFNGHSGPVNAIAIDATGKRVVTGADDQTAILWDAEIGKKIQSFIGPGENPGPGLVLLMYVESVAFSPDGKQVLTGSGDRTAIMWDSATGRKIRTFAGHSDMVRSVAFTPDGKFLVTGSQDHRAILWDAANGEQLRKFETPEGVVRAVAVSPDGKRILTAGGAPGDDGIVILWDKDSGQRIHRFRGRTSPIRSIALSPDGQQIATASSHVRSLLLWKSSGVSALTGHKSGVCSVAFSPDNKKTVTGSRDNSAIVWNSATGKQVSILKDHRDTVVAVAFCADGKQIVTGSEDRLAMLWDSDSGRLLRTFKGHKDAVMSLALSSDQKSLLTGSIDGTSLLWNMSDGKPVTSFDARGNPVFAVGFSADGKFVYFGSRQLIAICDPHFGLRLGNFTGHTDKVSCLAVSPDQATVLSGSWDGTAILWDLATRRPKHRFRGHVGTVESVAYAPDGKHLLTAAEDGIVILWNAISGRRLARLVPLDENKNWLIIAADGRFDGSEEGRKALVFQDDSAGPNVKSESDSYRWQPGLLGALLGKNAAPN